MVKKHTVLFALLVLSVLCHARVKITVDVAKGQRPISPYIYGKNCNMFDGEDLEVVRGAGLRISRETDGNNCTKYCWENDLSSHPDWYNNVYEQGWYERARAVQDKVPGLQGMFCFQVLGWAAKTGKYNADVSGIKDHSKRERNLCGDGKGESYLQPWGPKQTVGIVDHWFGPGGKGLDRSRFRIWHMDNEPACWISKHDDICPKELSAEQTVMKYVGVAKEAKTRHPDLYLMAPGFTSEWYWWHWTDNTFPDGLPWMEYFIKRMGEESKKVGRRLIDIVDFHSYSNMENNSPREILQEHRIFYDHDYDFPYANACQRYPGGEWGDNRVERIFGRTEEWLDKYFGKGHGITIGITEAYCCSPKGTIAALWYASMLGTFADHGVTVFTPWSWRVSFWEVMHLFSRYGGTVRVASKSSDEEMVSAYSSLREDGKLAVIMVNRHKRKREKVSLKLANFTPRVGAHTLLTLSDLPDKKQTFKSSDDNALKRGTLTLAGQEVELELPPWSIVAVIIEPGRQ